MRGMELVKRLEKEGWVVDRIHGSHYIMKNGDKTVVVPVHNTDLKIGLLKQIEKQVKL